MKKIIAIILSIVTVFFASAFSCDCNGPLRRKMLEYYENDKNYKQFSGIIRVIDYFEIKDEMYLEIELFNVDVLREDPNFTLFLKDGRATFVIVDWSKYSFELKEENVFFTSAGFQFYSTHTYPIIALSNEEEELISFVEGKQNYIDWINETFGEETGCL